MLSYLHLSYLLIPLILFSHIFASSWIQCYHVDETEGHVAQTADCRHILTHIPLLPPIPPPGAHARPGAHTIVDQTTPFYPCWHISHGTCSITLELGPIQTTLELGPIQGDVLDTSPMRFEILDAWPLIRQGIDEAIEWCADGEDELAGARAKEEVSGNNYRYEISIFNAGPDYRLAEQRRRMGLPHHEIPSWYYRIPGTSLYRVTYYEV